MNNNELMRKYINLLEGSLADMPTDKDEYKIKKLNPTKFNDFIVLSKLVLGVYPEALSEDVRYIGVLKKDGETKEWRAKDKVNRGLIMPKLSTEEYDAILDHLNKNGYDYDRNFFKMIDSDDPTRF